MSNDAHIVVRDLTMAYGSFLIQKDLSFTVNRSDIFIIMGGSGCGKSTLLKVMIGLKSPATGDVCYDGKAFWIAGEIEQEATKRKFGKQLRHVAGELATWVAAIRSSRFRWRVRSAWASTSGSMGAVSNGAGDSASSAITGARRAALSDVSRTPRVA